MATINIQVHKWGKPNGFRKRQCWLPMKWGNLTLKNAEDRKKQLDPPILKWFGALTNNVPARGEAGVTDAH